jgi:lycopene beta-cyclase
MVLDGRGFPEGNPLGLRGFQCFLGEEVQLQKPHGLSDPIVMDASVAQRDGFRFFYLLPFDSARLLIEDTRYTERPPQDWSDYRKGIQEFLDLRGWSVLRKFREESEALPIPLWAEDMRQNRSDEANSRVISVGVRGGFFHPTTGYSIPDAVRVAEALRESGIGPHTALRIRKVAQKRSRSPYCLLNRMMYLGTPAADRFRLLERFYRLPEESVARFYRSEMRGVDWLRLFGGRKPPLPILRAIRCAIARPGRREVWQHAWN